MKLELFLILEMRCKLLAEMHEISTMQRVLFAHLNGLDLGDSGIAFLDKQHLERRDRVHQDYVQRLKMLSATVENIAGAYPDLFSQSQSSSGGSGSDLSFEELLKRFSLS